MYYYYYYYKSASLLLLASLLISVLPRCKAADFGGGGIPGMDGEKFCKMFSCSKGYAPVPKKRGSGSVLKLTSAGCDAMGGGMVMMMGASKEKKPYEKCCDEWHACYQICGSNKQMCDKTYETCVDKTCEGYDEKDCAESAKLNIMLMNLGGCQKYEQAQNVACECVPKTKDKHLAARQSILEKFYKKYAPDKVDKAAQLIKKADTAPKLAVLFQKLVQKYPESIEKVEDPQKAAYQKMMDEAKVDPKVDDDELAKEMADDESDETEDLDDGAKEEL